MKRRKRRAEKKREERGERRKEKTVEERRVPRERGGEERDIR
jgi:hypothetical protein